MNFGGYNTAEEFMLQVTIVTQASTSKIYRIEKWKAAYFDVRMLQYWLRRCNDKHFNDCNSRRKDDSRGDTHIDFLVDLERRCIVPAQEGCRYTALSCRWFPSSKGPSMQLRKTTAAVLQEEGALSGDGFPKSILDAISPCSLLREGYLWIDQLCIIQDDPTPKMDQIKRMDMIYGSAAFHHSRCCW
jgi:hypothetical protein